MVSCVLGAEGDCMVSSCFPPARTPTVLSSCEQTASSTHRGVGTEQDLFDDVKL